MNVEVRDYQRRRLLVGSLIQNDLIAAAAERLLPFLGSVDPYDDTVFNRSQVTTILGELDLLVETAVGPMAEAAAEIRSAIALVQESPHRYLVFNGD